MTEPVSPLMAFSDHVAVLVERASASIVAVHGGGRWSSSGIHWRPGVIVTAEEVLERDDDLAVTLPGGRKVAASLAGRDPSTDVAALRIEAQSGPLWMWRMGLQSLPAAEVAALRAIPELPLNSLQTPMQGQPGPQPFCPLCQARNNYGRTSRVKRSEGSRRETRRRSPASNFR
jgi:trypsin-like peptidase